MLDWLLRIHMPATLSTGPSSWVVSASGLKTTPRSRSTWLETSSAGGLALLLFPSMSVFWVLTFLRGVEGWIQFLIVSLPFVFLQDHHWAITYTAVRNRLWNNTGFFLLIWAVHYVPFFLMNRQLFIHHYLPSHLASALIAGAVLNFVLSETINYPISVWGNKTKARPSQYSDIGIKGPVILVGFSFVLFLMFVFIAPLTYGTPG